jgi:hypothetical protein
LWQSSGLPQNALSPRDALSAPLETLVAPVGGVRRYPRPTYARTSARVSDAAGAPDRRSTRPRSRRCRSPHRALAATVMPESVRAPARIGDWHPNMWVVQRPVYPGTPGPLGSNPGTIHPTTAGPGLINPGAVHPGWRNPGSVHPVPVHPSWRNHAVVHPGGGRPMIGGGRFGRR